MVKRARSPKKRGNRGTKSDWSAMWSGRNREATIGELLSGPMMGGGAEVRKRLPRGPCADARSSGASREDSDGRERRKRCLAALDRPPDYYVGRGHAQRPRACVVLLYGVTVIGKYQPANNRGGRSPTVHLAGGSCRDLTPSRTTALGPSKRAPRVTERRKRGARGPCHIPVALSFYGHANHRTSSSPPEGAHGTQPARTTRIAEDDPA
jgi:hypothetical protein